MSYWSTLGRYVGEYDGLKFIRIKCHCALLDGRAARKTPTETDTADVGYM